jgi:hypothetical protein
MRDKDIKAGSGNRERDNAGSVLYTGKRVWDAP